MRSAIYDLSLKTVGSIGVLALLVNCILALALHVAFNMPMIIFRAFFFVFFAIGLFSDAKISDVVNGSRFLKIFAKRR